MANVNGSQWRVKPATPVGTPYTTKAVSNETAVTPGALNDTRRLFKIPRGVTFGMGTAVQIGDMDSGAGLVFTLRATKDGVSFKTLIHESTAGQAGGIARPTKGPTVEDGIGFTTDSHDWRCELIYTTAAAGAQAAALNVEVELLGYYKKGAVAE
jgi:hypothetical protein